MSNNLNRKKKAIIFHTVAGVVTLILLLLLFKQQQQYQWIYKAVFLLFIGSGVMIYAIFYQMLSFLEKTYFGFLFIATILLIGFVLFVQLFDLIFFGGDQQAAIPGAPGCFHDIIAAG